MSETYDVDMFDPPPDPDLICCICQGVLNGPVESPCRHVYCRRCIERWLGNNENCPTCRDVLHTSELKPVLPILQNMINRLTRKCRFMFSGCKEKIPVERYESHIKTCDFELFDCRFSKCGQRVLRKDLRIHEEETCLFRELKCTRDCELMILFSDIDSHDCLLALKQRLEEVEEKRSKLMAQVTKMLDNQEYLVKEVNKLRTQSERRRRRRHTSLFSDFSVSTDSSDSFHTDTDLTDSTESEILSPPQSPENFAGNPTTRARTRARDTDPSASRNDVNGAAENEPDVDVVTVDVDSEISFNLRGRNVRLPSSSSESGSENRTVADAVTVDGRQSSTHTSQNNNRARMVKEETVVRRYNPGDPALRDLDFLPPEGSNERKLVGPVIHTTTTRMYRYCDDNVTNVNEPENRNVPCTSASVLSQENPSIENMNYNCTTSTATSREDESANRDSGRGMAGSEEEFAYNNPSSSDTFYHGDTSLDVSNPYSSCRSSDRSEDRERRSSRSVSQSSSHSCSSGYSKDMSNSQTNYGSSSSKSPSRNWSDLESPSRSYSRHTKSFDRSPSPSPTRKCSDRMSRSPTRSYSRGRSRSHSSGYSKSPTQNMHSSPYSSASSIPYTRFSRSRWSRSRSHSRGHYSPSSTDSSRSRGSCSESKPKKRRLHKGKVTSVRKDTSSFSISNDSDVTSSSDDGASLERGMSPRFSVYSYSSNRSEAEYALSSPMRRSRRGSSTSSSGSSFNPRKSSSTHMPDDANSKSRSSSIHSPDRSPSTDRSSNEKTRSTKQCSFSDDGSVNSDVSFSPYTPLSPKQSSRNQKSSESCNSMSTDSSLASDTSFQSSVIHVRESDRQDGSLSSGRNSVVDLNSTLSSVSSQSSPSLSSQSSSSEVENKITEEKQLSDCASPWESTTESDTLHQVISSPSIKNAHNGFKCARTDQGSAPAKYTESVAVRRGDKDQRPSKGSQKNDTRAKHKQSASKTQNSVAQSSTTRTGSEVISDPHITVSERFRAAELENQPEDLQLPCQPLLTTGASVPVTSNKLRKEHSGQGKKRPQIAEESDSSLTKSKKTCKEKVLSAPSAHNNTSSSLLWYNTGCSKSNNPTVNVKIDLSLNVEPRPSMPSRKEECTTTSSKPSTVCTSSSTVAAVNTVMDQSKNKARSEQFSRPPKESLSRKFQQKTSSKKPATLGKPSSQAKRQAAHPDHAASGASETRNSHFERHSFRREEEVDGGREGDQSLDRHLFLLEDTDESSDESWSPGRHSDATDVTISEEIESDSSYELVVPKSTKQLLDELANTNDDSDDTWSPSSYFSPSP